MATPTRADPKSNPTTRPRAGINDRVTRCGERITVPPPPRPPPRRDDPARPTPTPGVVVAPARLGGRPRRLRRPWPRRPGRPPAPAGPPDGHFSAHPAPPAAPPSGVRWRVP